MSKLDLAADVSEYVANLVNANGCKRATLLFITWVIYWPWGPWLMPVYNDILLTDIIGYDRLKFI